MIASPSIARYPDYKTARFATIWEAVRPTLTIAPMPVCHNRPSRLEGFHPPPGSRGTEHGSLPSFRSSRPILWATTGGSSPTGERFSPTGTNRRSGSSTAATSASSTQPDRTTGSSATATAAPSRSDSAGRRSSATRWSKGQRLPTIRPGPLLADRRRKKTPPPLDKRGLRLLKAHPGAARSWSLSP